jgi:hypothetical protein
VLHPTDADAATAHAAECGSLAAKLAKRAADAAIECCICFERVLAKPQLSQRRFGLMSCEHAFCLGCIRNWRATGEVEVKTVRLLRGAAAVGRGFVCGACHTHPTAPLLPPLWLLCWSGAAHVPRLPHAHPLHHTQHQVSVCALLLLSRVLCLMCCAPSSAPTQHTPLGHTQVAGQP